MPLLRDGCTAAEVMAVAAALVEPRRVEGLAAQPRVSRSVMLTLAQRHNTELRTEQ